MTRNFGLHTHFFQIPANLVLPAQLVQDLQADSLHPYLFINFCQLFLKSSYLSIDAIECFCDLILIAHDKVSWNLKEGFINAQAMITTCKSRNVPSSSNCLFSRSEESIPSVMVEFASSSSTCAPTLFRTRSRASLTKFFGGGITGSIANRQSSQIRVVRAGGCKLALLRKM